MITFLVVLYDTMDSNQVQAVANRSLLTKWIKLDVRAC